MNENEIDYGSIKVPTSWDEVSVGCFEKIEEYYRENKDVRNITDMAAIMIGKDKDFVMSLPSDFLGIILSKLDFMSTPPEQKEPTNKIVIDNEVYQVNIRERLRTGEYCAVEMAMKDNPRCFANILAILCRKEGEIYDSKFENEILPERVKLFESQPITNVLPVATFFLECYIALGTTSQLYSKVEEAVNLIAESIKSSTKLGLGRKLYMKWQERKLRRLLKSIKST